MSRVDHDRPPPLRRHLAVADGDEAQPAGWSLLSTFWLPAAAVRVGMVPRGGLYASASSWTKRAWRRGAPPNKAAASDSS